MDRIVSFDKQLQVKLSIIRLFISMWSFDKDCLSLLIEEIQKVSNLKHFCGSKRSFFTNFLSLQTV